jgi:hypothetical protein
MKNRAIYKKMFPLVDIPTYSYDDVKRVMRESNEVKNAGTWLWFKASFLRTCYIYLLLSFSVSLISENLLLVIPMMILYAVLHCIMNCPIQKWYLKVSMIDAEIILRYELCKSQLEAAPLGYSKKNEQIRTFCGTILDD